MKKIIGLFSLGMLSLSLSASAKEAAKVENPMKKGYEAKCGMCHGKDGKGNVNLAKGMKIDPASLVLVSSQTLAKKDEDWAALIAKGKGKMPAYEKQLKPEEIQGLIGYIRSLEETEK